jgi:hypothetical protein
METTYNKPAIESYRAGRRGHRDGVTTDPITKINATLYFEHAISLSI